MQTFCPPLLVSSHLSRDTHATGHFTPLQGHTTKKAALFGLRWCCLLVFLINKSPAAHPVTSWSHVTGACVGFPRKRVYDLWTVFCRELSSVSDSLLCYKTIQINLTSTNYFQILEPGQGWDIWQTGLTRRWVRIPTAVTNNSHVVLFTSFLYRRWSVEVSGGFGFIHNRPVLTPEAANALVDFVCPPKSCVSHRNGIWNCRLEPPTQFSLLALSAGQSPPGQEGSVARKGKVAAYNKVARSSHDHRALK